MDFDAFLQLDPDIVLSQLTKEFFVSKDSNGNTFEEYIQKNFLTMKWYVFDVLAGFYPQLKTSCVPTRNQIISLMENSFTDVQVHNIFKKVTTNPVWFGVMFPNFKISNGKKIEQSDEKKMEQSDEKKIEQSDEKKIEQSDEKKMEQSDEKKMEQSDDEHPNSS